MRGQIAYAAGADHQIFLLDLATGESRQLTDLTEEHAELTGQGPLRPVLSCGFGVSWLAWSPRGAPLAFSYGGCDTVVFVADLDGTTTRIADGRVPAWSPNGSHLVFSPNTPFCMGVADCGQPPRPGAWNLQITEIDADEPPGPMMVGAATSQPGVSTWSPDGTLIAFSAPPQQRGGDAGTFSATHVARADGSDTRHLVDGAWPSGWLPDGRLLIVEEETGVVHALELETGITTPIGGGLEGSTVVSPDGTRFISAVSHPGTGALRVRLATIDGEVLAERSGTISAWAPDGRAAAILDLEHAGGIVIVDRDGNELHSYGMPDAFNVWALAWRPGS